MESNVSAVIEQAAGRKIAVNQAPPERRTTPAEFHRARMQQ
jgi:hypothetical protein